LSHLNLCFSERLSSTKVHLTSDRMNMLLLWGMVFVLLLILVGIAFLQAEGLSDYDDLSIIHGDARIREMESVFFASLSVSFALAVFANVLRLEYLKSHIGEKRPDSRMINDISLFARFLKTALLYSVVFLLSFAQFLSSGNWFTPVFARDRSARFRSKKRFHFIFGGL